MQLIKKRATLPGRSLPLVTEGDGTIVDRADRLQSKAGNCCNSAMPLPRCLPVTT